MRRAAAVLLATWSVLAAAQSTGGAFELRRHVVAAGGGRSTGGDFVLTGTAAQHEASEVAARGAYGLSPGFWAAVATSGPPGPDPLFADSFE